MFEKYGSKSRHVPTKDLDIIFGNQAAVFEYYWIKPDLRARYYSPFREEDSRPGCRFSIYRGKLYFIDNAGWNGRLSFDCIAFVQEIFGLTYKEAVIKILEEVTLIDVTLIEDPSFKSIIKALPDKNNPQGEYFKQFEVNPLDIHGFKVDRYWANIKNDPSLRLNRFGIDEEVYAFYFKDTDKTNLYFPNRTENKFYKSSTQHDLYGSNRLSQFTFNEPLIITKSAKDVLVLLKYFNNVVALQSETSFSFSSYFFSFPLIVIWFDNDYTGIKYSLLYQDYLKSKGLNNTIVFSHGEHYAKDPADIYLTGSHHLNNIISYDLNRKIQDTYLIS